VPQKSARGGSGAVSPTSRLPPSLTEAHSSRNPDRFSKPSPDTHLLPLTTPLTPPNSHPPPPREVKLFLSPVEFTLLVSQAETWAQRHLPTSGIAHRPPLKSGYVGWLVRERQKLSDAPRADSRKQRETAVRYARSVAPWDSIEHKYDGPPKVPRSRLSLRRALLTEFPKEGDSALRRRAIHAAYLDVVTPVESREILDPMTISVSEVGKLAWFKPADAVRFCEASP
jgi:hypothetical protein